MKYCRHESIVTDTKGIPDAEIFTVYRNKDSTWAFGMRINGVFTLTPFISQDAEPDRVFKAKKQIMFAKTYGWSYMGRKAWNTEVDDHEHEFMCLYCRAISFDTSQPCVCRNKRIEDLMRKTPSGIILPY